MKKIITVFYFLTVAAAANAQDAGLPPRAMTQAELDRWQTVCSWLNNAIPGSFKDYTFKETACNSFDWAETNRQGQPLTVIDKKGQAIGNHPNYSAWFSMSEDSVDAREKELQVMLLLAKKDDNTFDPKDLDAISVKESKLLQCKTLRVAVQTNVQISLAKQYEKSTRPEKISLPVNAFAFLYKYPEGKDVAEEGSSIGTDGLAFFKDKALIILSTKPPKVTPVPPCQCTWREEKIMPQDDAPYATSAPLKNIVVEIEGFENDVREMIKQVDWKALQALIGK